MTEKTDQRDVPHDFSLYGFEDEEIDRLVQSLAARGAAYADMVRMVRAALEAMLDHYGGPFENGPPQEFIEKDGRLAKTSIAAAPRLTVADINRLIERLRVPLENHLPLETEE